MINVVELLVPKRCAGINCTPLFSVLPEAHGNKVVWSARCLQYSHMIPPELWKLEPNSYLQKLESNFYNSIAGHIVILYAKIIFLKIWPYDNLGVLKLDSSFSQ